MTPNKAMALTTRVLWTTVVAALIAFSTNARAQNEAPSPSPSPSRAPAATVSPSPFVPPMTVKPVIADTDMAATVKRPLSDVDAAEIEAEVERAQAEARREMARAMRSMETAQASSEREARQAAENMASMDEVRARASAEARLVTAEALRAAAAERAAAVRESSLESDQDAREQEREARDKAREKAQEDRDKAREKAQEQREKDRERARAARDRQREQSESLEDLYDQAMDSIDDEDWSDALRPLSKLMSMNMKMDAALYWTSYAQCKMDRTGAALESLARLQKEFPTSRWAKEGKALEMEVRGRSGQVPRPDQEDDLDLKLMAVSALAQTDPQEAMPVLTRILASPSSSRKVRERSLFVLAQIGSEQASNAIAEVAKGNSSPELQRKAIQYLGVFGGANNRKVLSDIYASNTDNTIRKQILNSFMVSGDKARVLTAAKTEKDPSLRADAVRLLGVMGGTMELSQMYSTATSTEEKKAIIHALFIGGAVEPVAAAAKGEKDKEVRLTAIRSLGLMGRKSQDVLAEMYRAETDPDVKKEVLNAFFLQNNSMRLVEIARVEKDPSLKKEAVHWLSLMNSKEARAYMMELLKD
ncbi:MAG: HEAT repeat domain-containing protein [Vicinamibacteria bacterium]|nr:HEAT repeat domain-containing protein [Vicinamibacteria bacterium]